MNFKKIISLLTVFTLVFSLLAPLQSSANDFTGESNETNLIFEPFIEYNEEVTSSFLESDLVFDSNEITIEPMCGPPCGYIAVIAVRSVVNGVARAILKNSAGKTIKTIVPAASGAAANTARNYVVKNITVNGKSFSIPQERMKHFLERHSMNHWNGSWAPNNTPQSFFHPGMTVQQIEKIAFDGLRANSSKLVGEGFITFNHSHNGIVYQIGVNMKQRAITQIYPRTTYVSPF